MVIEDWTDPERDCCHVTEVEGQAVAYCNEQAHDEAGILNRWKGTLNGYANGHVPPPPSVFQWKMMLYELGKRAIDELIAADAGSRQFIEAMDLPAFIATVEKIRNQPAMEMTFDPVGLNQTEIAEEIEAVAKALSAKYAKQDLGKALGDLPPPSRPKAKGLILLKDYLKQYAERAAQPYVWDGTLYLGTFNMLLGRAFAGKSSIAAAMLRAMVRGEPFLGRLTRKSRVGYFALERNGSAVGKLLDAWGLSDEVYFADEIQDLKVAEFIERNVKQSEIEVLFIDHLQHAVHIREGNQYTEVSEALKPYQDIARKTGACIIALHHQGKPSKDKEKIEVDETVIDALGSEAYRAACETMMEATAFRGEHFFRAQPRAGEWIERTRVVIDFETGEVEGTDTRQADVQAAILRIQDFLFRLNMPAPEKEIRANVIGDNKTLTEAVREGLRQGLFARSGAGGKSDPYRYSLRNADNEDKNRQV